MSLIDLLLHSLNFAAPAAVVAGLLVLCNSVLFRKTRAQMNSWFQWAAIFLVGLSALLLGLWAFGTDGKLATYTVLVLGCNTAQWLLMRGWQLK